MKPRNKLNNVNGGGANAARTRSKAANRRMPTAKMGVGGGALQSLQVRSYVKARAALLLLRSCNHPSVRAGHTA